MTTRTRAGIGIAAAIVVALVLIVSLAGGSQSSRRRPARPFAWLQPAAAPHDWHVARTAGGATLPYPPGWRPLQTDPGTASVAVRGRGDLIDAYLNATPKQGTETLANWSHFRPAHNSGEGSQDIRLIASATGLAFRSGRGSCVIDDYTTSKARYREIACLVSRHGSSAVVVAAARKAVWRKEAATLERAVSGFVP